MRKVALDNRYGVLRTYVVFTYPCFRHFGQKLSAWFLFPEDWPMLIDQSKAVALLGDTLLTVLATLLPGFATLAGADVEITQAIDNFF